MVQICLRRPSPLWQPNVLVPIRWQLFIWSRNRCPLLLNRPKLSLSNGLAVNIDIRWLIRRIIRNVLQLRLLSTWSILNRASAVTSRRDPTPLFISLSESLLLTNKARTFVQFTHTVTYRAVIRDLVSQAFRHFLNIVCLISRRSLGASLRFLSGDLYFPVFVSIYIIIFCSFPHRMVYFFESPLIILFTRLPQLSPL